MSIFTPKTKIITDEATIDQVLSRGVENIYPTKEALKKVLMSGQRLRIYLGVDPNGAHLHLGHLIPIMKLSALRDLGHEVIFLFGSFTAMIGDPDKKETRRQLTYKQVMENVNSFKKQLGKFLQLGGSNRVKLKYNHTWLGRMGFKAVLELTSKMTVQQMLERDLFDRRIKEGNAVYIHEFLYPLMQGYDSVAMRVDMEIGGNDQTFNMLVGRHLSREYLNKEKFVLTTKLLVDPTGKKMGKSEGNMVTLSDSAQDIFGKVMSWNDGMIIDGFELCTKISNEEIGKHKNHLGSGANPRDAKLDLAYEVTKLIKGEKEAELARESFIGTFSKGDIPTDIPSFKFEKSKTVLEAVVEIAPELSKSDIRRLLDAGGVSILETGEKVKDPNSQIESGTYKIGKKKFVKVVAS